MNKLERDDIIIDLDINYIYIKGGGARWLIDCNDKSEFLVRRVERDTEIKPEEDTLAFFKIFDKLATKNDKREVLKDSLMCDLIESGYWDYHAAEKIIATCIQKGEVYERTNYLLAKTDQSDNLDDLK